tara:strand:- start:3172 stop:3276 length:105 start_codon:yes stop_codon:yes gene_type:complete
VDVAVFIEKIGFEGRGPKDGGYHGDKCDSQKFGI